MSERADDVGNMETDVAGGEDLISALPNDVLRYLLSFLPSRNAVQTCVLAKRWRTLWKSVPALRIKDDPLGRFSYEDPVESGGMHISFVNDLLRLRAPTALNECHIYSSYGKQHRFCEDFNGYPWCVDDPEMSFPRIEPWIRYALSHEVRVLRVEGASSTTNLALVSSHLKRVELISTHFDGSLDFSSCPVLHVLELSSCSISGNILSQSLRHLNIKGRFFDYDIRSRISAPNIISLKLDQDHGLPPLLDSMSSLVTACIDESTDCEQYAQESFSVVLQGLSSAASLELITPYYEHSVFRMDLKWCPMFSKLKRLVLNDWCLADNFTGMVYFLHHSPILEVLMLQLDIKKYEKYQFFRDERNNSIEQGYNSREHGYNSRDQSLISKHLKVVKIICGKKQDVKVELILKILCTHGVPSEKIDIK